MRPGGAHAHPAVAGDLGHVAAQLAQLALDVRGRVADGSRDLEHRLHQLGVDARLELVPVGCSEHGVDVLHEVERLAVEEHVLLFDPERVRVAPPESMVEHAATLGEPAASSGDRRRIDLVHASASRATSCPFACEKMRRAASTSGRPIRTVASILATNWPFTRSSLPVPNASTMKTTESSGVETRLVPTTRTASGTRPRTQAPRRLSVVSETAKAARLAPTMRHVWPRTWSKC